jgi:hypothetical protein
VNEIEDSWMKPATASICRTLTVIALLVLAAGCARMQTEKGLDPTWHRLAPETFQVGVSTQSDVMRLLGPPSQVITGQGGDILYYLHEQAVGTGIVFIVYNQLQLTTRYDRAIFFFDEAGVLVDYAISEPPGSAQ